MRVIDLENQTPDKRNGRTIPNSVNRPTHGEMMQKFSEFRQNERRAFQIAGNPLAVTAVQKNE